MACDKEGNDSSSKGDGNMGGGQMMSMRAMAKLWVMATVMRPAGNKEGKGEGGKGNGDGNVKVVDKEEGKGSKAMVLATRMVDK